MCVFPRGVGVLYLPRVVGVLYVLPRGVGVLYVLSTGACVLYMLPRVVGVLYVLIGSIIFILHKEGVSVPNRTVSARGEVVFQ